MDDWSDSPYARDWSAGAFAPPGVIWLGDIPLDRARELVATGDWTVIGAPLPPLPAPTIAAPPPPTPAPEPTGSSEIPDMPWPQPTEPGGAGVDIEPGIETPPDYALDTPTARPVGPVNPVDVSGGPEGSGGSFGIGAPPPLGGASFPPTRPMPRDTRGPRRGSPVSGGYDIESYKRQVERAQRDTVIRQRAPRPQIWEGEVVGPTGDMPAPMVPPRFPRLPRPRIAIPIPRAQPGAAPSFPSPQPTPVPPASETTWPVVVDLPPPPLPQRISTPTGTSSETLPSAGPTTGTVPTTPSPTRSAQPSRELNPILIGAIGALLGSILRPIHRTPTSPLQGIEQIFQPQPQPQPQPEPEPVTHPTDPLTPPRGDPISDPLTPPRDAPIGSPLTSPFGPPSFFASTPEQTDEDKCRCKERKHERDPSDKIANVTPYRRRMSNWSLKNLNRGTKAAKLLQRFL